MARWSQRTLMHPDLWAELVGFEPCVWNGVRLEAERGCELWYQQPYHADPPRAGRETVGAAVLQAERRLGARLGFPVAPRYFEAQEVPWPARGYQVRLRHGYVGAVGREGRDTVGVGAAIVYSDADLDGVTDTGTITVATTVTDPCEIAVYYPGVVDAAGVGAADETWRLRPTSVTITGGNAVITIPRCALVLWALHAAGTIVEDVNDDANFLTTVDVFRRYTDPEGSAAVWYDDVECGSGCGEETQDVCGHVVDARAGIVRLLPATYSGGTWTQGAWNYATCPDVARVAYLAGWTDPTDTGCERWGELAEVVAKLSLTFLREDICQCARFQWLWDYATEELKIETRGIASAYQLFGSTKRGALDAYVWWREHALTRGGTLT